MQDFLPISKDETEQRGWSAPDFVYVNGDAYVDHPSFGAAIITRVLENKGFRVAVLAQPDWRNTSDFKRFGKPRLGFLVSGGNIDSMVAHYTSSKKKRNYDYYSPGGKPGLRPDRAVIVYCNMIRQAYGDMPIIIGGLEASLRRFAHYDYWSGKVRRSILVDARADILSYGMGEASIARVAELLERGIPVKKIRDVRGTTVLCEREYNPRGGYSVSGNYNELKTDKKAYARAFLVQYNENDHINGKPVLEFYDEKVLVCNPPMPPLPREALDKVYALPYMRDYHPSYKKVGGVPAIEEVKFSITHNRGCFGACNFCAITYHSGRYVTSRSIESVVREAKIIAGMPDFKGYIHDIGGATANFRENPCEKCGTNGVCKNKRCLAPSPCASLKIDHSEYKRIIEAVEQIPKVKKVFIRSGIRYDYLLLDPDRSFFEKLVRDNVSGQLKVAPEHISAKVLNIMGKPPQKVFEKFAAEYFSLCAKYGKEQYLVPYLMSSHPGSRIDEAVELAVYLKENGISPEQVQDFYPTPGTASTCIYYTGLNPFDGTAVYVPSDYNEKRLQRALLQPNRPENRAVIKQAGIKIERFKK